MSGEEMALQPLPEVPEEVICRVRHRRGVRRVVCRLRSAVRVEGRSLGWMRSQRAAAG